MLLSSAVAAEVMMLRRASMFGAAGASALAAHWAHKQSLCKSKPDGITKLRTEDFELADHCHGKARVRVLRVRRDTDVHTVQEYNVATRLFSPVYSGVFTEENNAGLVATDTQKNTVYIVAKRSSATSPEGYAIDVCRHLLTEYPVLSAVEVEVQETIWQRVNNGGPHEHGFTKVRARGEGAKGGGTNRCGSSYGRDDYDLPHVDRCCSRCAAGRPGDEHSSRAVDA